MSDPNIKIDGGGPRPIIQARIVHADAQQALNQLLDDIQDFRDDFPILTDAQKWQRLDIIIGKMIKGMVYMAGEIRRENKP